MLRSGFGQASASDDDLAGGREMREVRASKALRRLALGENAVSASASGIVSGPAGLGSSDDNEDAATAEGLDGADDDDDDDDDDDALEGETAIVLSSSDAALGSAGGSQLDVFVVTRDAYFAAAASTPPALAPGDSDADDAEDDEGGDRGAIAAVSGAPAPAPLGPLDTAAAVAASAAADVASAGGLTAGTSDGGGSSPFDERRVINGIDLAKFYRWATCFCVVTFDLELGQGAHARATVTGRSPWTMLISVMLRGEARSRCCGRQPSSWCTRPRS